MARSLLFAAALLAALPGAAGAGEPDVEALERRVRDLEAENARLRAGLAEATRLLREAARAAERAAAAPAAPPIGRDAVPRDAGPLGRLREAHEARDEAGVLAAERELIHLASESEAARDELRLASGRERKFNVKVSLDFVLRSAAGACTLRHVLSDMRATRDAGEKMRLAFVLSKLDLDDGVAAEAVEALEAESDPMIQKYLVRALGAASGAGGLDALARIAGAGKDRNLRIEAIRALEARHEGGAGGAHPEALAALLDLAKDDPDASIRSIAIRALASVAAREQAPFFLDVLRRDERTNNRAEAAKFFGRAGTDADIPALEALHDAERVYYIRQKIRQAIDGIRDRAAF